MILDEPTVGLDPKQIIEIRSLIEKLGKHHTVILSSHILSEIQAICKRIIIINRGEIVADDLAENLAKNMSADHSITIRVQGPEASVSTLLSSIKEIESVTTLGIMESGSVDYLIEPKEDCDVRRAIFERLSERKWPILELSSKQLTLEQIFLRLTEGVTVQKEEDKPAQKSVSTKTKKAAVDAVFGEEE